MSAHKRHTDSHCPITHVIISPTHTHIHSLVCIHTSYLTFTDARARARTHAHTQTHTQTHTHKHTRARAHSPATFTLITAWITLFTRAASSLGGIGCQRLRWSFLTLTRQSPTSTPVDLSCFLHTLPTISSREILQTWIFFGSSCRSSRRKGFRCVSLASVSRVRVVMCVVNTRMWADPALQPSVSHEKNGCACVLRAARSVRGAGRVALSRFRALPHNAKTSCEIAAPYEQFVCFTRLCQVQDQPTLVWSSHRPTVCSGLFKRLSRCPVSVQGETSAANKQGACDSSCIACIYFWTYMY